MDDQQPDETPGLFGHPGLPVSADRDVVIGHRCRLAAHAPNIQGVGASGHLGHRPGVAAFGSPHRRLFMGLLVAGHEEIVPLPHRAEAARRIIVIRYTGLHDWAT